MSPKRSGALPKRARRCPMRSTVRWKQGHAFRVEPHAVAPAPPMGRVADAGVEIPGVAGEVVWRGPVSHMFVHAGGGLAQNLEPLADRRVGLRRLDPLLPIEQHDVARPRHRRVAHGLDQLAVAAGVRNRRDRRAVAPQRREPGKLGRDRGFAVVALAVHAQGPAPVRSRVIDAIRGVLRQIDHLDACVRRQVVVGKRRRGEFPKMRQLLLVGELVEGLDLVHVAHHPHSSAQAARLT
jgi:hypothetical protein